jgi:hypothetical protein
MALVALGYVVFRFWTVAGMAVNAVDFLVSGTA